MNNSKIVPGLWFTVDGGSISTLLEYYKIIFAADFSCGNIISPGNTPSGKTEMCDVNIFGQKYVLMSTEKEHHPLNDALSFIIYCEDQNEIDKYWDYFTSEGKESQCGWCTDKYGLRWQVLPKNLGELMHKPDSFKVMAAQKKIVIEDYLK